MLMQPIRSYVRRQGRMINAQRQALNDFGKNYIVSPEGLLDPGLLFGRKAPLHLEIGFGMGDALLHMAQMHLDNNYLGSEVYLPGVGQLLLGLQENNISNVRIYRYDAVELLVSLPPQSLAGVYLFFPDPWLKKRHHKRRLVKADFIILLENVLEDGGVFHAATDCEEYVVQMMDLFEKSDFFTNRAGSGNFHPRPSERPVTKFEQRSLLQGNRVREVIFEKSS